MMKKLALFVSLLLVGQAIGWSNYHDILTEEVSFRRSFGAQQTLDSNYRLRGMGFLSLPIQDDSNTIGIYKYMDMAAGIPLDYKWGKVEATYFGDYGRVDDNGTALSAYKGDLADIDKNAMSIFTHVPIKWGCGPGGLVTAKQWDFSDFELTVPGTNSKEDLSNRDFTLAYGHNVKNWIAGLSFEHALDRVETEIGTSQDDERTYTTEISPSFGYMFNLNNDKRFTVAGGPRFIQEELEGSPGITEYDVDGTKFTFGGLFEQGNRLRIGGYIDTGELKGDRTFNGAGAGERELDRTKYNLRSYWMPETMPFSFGLSYENTNRTVKLFNSAGTNTSDRETDRSNFGLGSAYHFRSGRGLVGIEYQRIAGEITENLSPSTSALNREEDGYQVSLGTEFSLNDKLRWRFGYRYKEITTDPVGTPPEADFDLSEVSTGADFKLSPSLDLGLAMWLTDEGQESIAGIQDEAEFDSFGFQTMLKYSWGDVPPPPPAP